MEVLRNQLLDGFESFLAGQNSYLLRKTKTRF